MAQATPAIDDDQLSSRVLIPALGGASVLLSMAGVALLASGWPPAALIPAALATSAWVAARAAQRARAAAQAVSWTREQLVELRRQYAEKLEAVEDLRLLRRIDEATRQSSDPGTLLSLATSILSEGWRFDVVRILGEEPTPDAEALGVQNVMVAKLGDGFEHDTRLLAGSHDRRLGPIDERLLDQAAHTLAMALEAGQSLQRLDALVQERTEQLERATERLVSQARMASVGQLVDGLVHEIKNPLNFTRNGAIAIERRLEEIGVDDPAVHRAAEIVTTGSDRILEVVDALAGLSRRRGGAAVPFDLRSAVADTLTLVEADLRMRGIEIEVESTGSTDVTCRPGEIRQVLLNLVSNGGQAMKDAGGTLRIELVGRDDEVVVSVQDEGPGVADSVRERVFDPYFTTKAPGEGTGLGLSVAAHIAESHGGALRLADDPPGGGARFELTLPRQPPSGS